ncbi:MAG: hypothetical protein FWH23_01940 [Bacteroidales bacterium]|nr:hypothetical protein [Bacteroidales bacterium]
MNPIKNNPYRTLGLLAGASAKEIIRQTNRLQKIIATGQKPPTDDFSFPALGNLKRTTESIEETIAKLNLDRDKMNAALFWFWNGNPITDEVAFEALKEGDIDKAYQIWDKLIVETKEDGKRFWRQVTEKNCSAFHNCFVLEMLRENGNKHTAIVANLYFLESEFSQKFISTIADKIYRTNSKELQINFLSEILQETVQIHTNLTLSKFVSILNNIDFIAKVDFFKSISQKFANNISAQIETSKRKRTTNKANAAKTGEELYQQAKNDLEQLKSIVGVQDFTFSNIADKAANEILQCGVDYFLHYRDTNIDPSTVSMALFKKAKLIVVGNLHKQRIEENIENLQEWIDDKPKRERENRIAVDLQFITSKLERFQSSSDTIFNAKDLAVSCKPKLDNVKTILGAYDDLYLKLSSAVVGNTQGMLVSVVNTAQENLKVQMYINGTTALNSLKTIIQEALEVINYLGSFDMDSALRARYDSNKSTLQGISNQVNALTQPTSSGGCYIATMAYGSYEHPQVMILRQFRDDVLDKSVLGRWFIKFYYHYSPKLVEALKDKQFINKSIRNMLNQFIKVIK